jgi:hypothetical protein
MLKFDSPKEFGESLIKGVSKTGIPTIRLLWANGVVFRATRYPTDAVISQELRGILNLNHVDFAPMKEYQESIGEVLPGVKIPVVDVSHHTLFGPLTNYIKEHFLK